MKKTEKVLIHCECGVTNSDVPAEVLAPGGLTAWQVCWDWLTVNSMLYYKLREKTMGDVQALFKMQTLVGASGPDGRGKWPSSINVPYWGGTQLHLNCDADRALNALNWHSDTDKCFCCSCGENGHLAGKCQNLENQPKVIQRLITKKGANSTYSYGDATPKEKCRRHAGGFRHGHLCDALLYTSSWIIIVLESWYRRYLSETPIRPMSKLNIWGLSDSSFPCLGFWRRWPVHPSTCLSYP